MPQTRAIPCNPDNPDDKYTVALQDVNGGWYGFTVDLNKIRERQTNASPPQQKIGQQSFHGGRGVETWLPNSFGFYDSKDAWTSTPGKAHPTMLWRFAKNIDGELKFQDMNMPGSQLQIWKPLVGIAYSVAVTASETYSAAYSMLIVRKKVAAGTVGKPGTLTVEWCIDSGGSPSTVQKTITAAATDMPDTTVYYYVFTPATVLALTAATVYHIKIYGASTDTDGNCWEVLCDTTAAGKQTTTSPYVAGFSATTFSPFYYLSEADIARTFHMFEFDGAFYYVSNKDSAANSQLYINGTRGQPSSAGSSTTLNDSGAGQWGSWTTNIWAGAYIRIIRGPGSNEAPRVIASNTGTQITITTAWNVTPTTASEYVIYSTDWVKEITGHGLGQVINKPVTTNGICYFPQGDTVTSRRMHLDYTQANDHAFAAESTTKLYHAVSGYDGSDGPQLWRSNNDSGTGSGGKVTVSRGGMYPSGAPLAWGTNVAFKTAIPAGNNTYPITNLHVHQNNLYAIKADTMFVIQNDKAVNIKTGFEASPSIYNGKAVITAKDSNFYMGAAHDVWLVTGSGVISTGIHNDADLPSGRSGYAADFEAEYNWLFTAWDAGAGGTSSVMKYNTDSQRWSEQLRSYASGKRIRAVKWQSCPETRPRLWVEVAGNLVFQEFPLWGVRPLQDTGILYMPEWVMETSTIDLLTTDPKYYSTIAAITKGLAQITDTETGHELYVEYQTDSNVGTSTWYKVGRMTLSPLDELPIDKGSRSKLRLRYRGVSPEPADPVVLEQWQISLLARTVLYTAWTFFCELLSSDEEQKSLEVIDWLNKQAITAQPLTIFSNYPAYHRRRVILNGRVRQAGDEFDIETGWDGNIAFDVAELNSAEA